MGVSKLLVDDIIRPSREPYGLIDKLFGFDLSEEPSLVSDLVLLLEKATQLSSLVGLELRYLRLEQRDHCAMILRGAAHSCRCNHGCVSGADRTVDCSKTCSIPALGP